MIRYYEKGDIDAINMRGVDFISPLIEEEGFDKNVATMVIGDKPVAIIGVQFLWDGVAQVWALISDEARGHGLELTRSCKALMKFWGEDNNIKRFNCTVNASNEEYVRWAKIVGFKEEFRMEKASPDGSDLIGFVNWTKEN